MANYFTELFTVIKAKENLFLQAFSKPIPRDPMTVLEHLRVYGSWLKEDDLDQSIDFDNQTSILSINLYLSLEKNRENTKQETNPLNWDMKTGITQPHHIRNTLSMVDECEHIQNKALFDAINEAIDLYRPNGKTGAVLDFERQPKRKIDYSQLSSSTPILTKVQKKVESWTAYGSGILPSDKFLNT